jgi:excisionase family DNA binding protein
LKRLLNIHEAAEFLNVSEMTIRRWTNHGDLKCYRVGGRRARRFKLQDLHSYLETNTRSTRSGMVSLGFGELEVPEGAHVTHLSNSADESLDVAAAYVADGLTRNDTTCIVAPDAEIENVLVALRQRKLDVDGFVKAGRLHVNSGMKTPRGQARYLSQIAGLSRSRLRIFGDMTWTKEKRWRLENLLELEEMANTSPTKNMLILCQYKLDRFSGEEAMSAIEAHSHNIYRGLLKENPYRG